MCAEAGGEKFVGHTYVDHMNFSSRLKMKTIEGKDSQSVINTLIQKGEDDPDFFYRVKLNEMGQVSNIFWRDAMMKEDYEVFGDVCVFDTTYRTNKYNLICAPFVGINNHWSNAMFGCAFITDEKIETFEWLFETFLASMGGKAPTSLFTDQDQAMTNAIGKVFPQTRHRLCLWHLQQNAVSRFGELKADNTFKDAFKKCLYGCYDEEEFEENWCGMIDKYKLQNHSWFTHLYTLKEKWCTTLNKDFFSAGILSSQRSESTNHAIGFKGNKSTTLKEFFHIFSATVDRWRNQEDQDKFKCDTSLPKSDFPMVGMISHAATIYTLNLFRDFEKEVKYSMRCISTIEKISGDFLYYRVQPETWPDRTAQHVAYDPSSNTVVCSCKNFEESGWLCYHAIRVLSINSVTLIPGQYISKRWTKYAKSEVWKRVENREDLGIEKGKVTPWRYEMARSFYNLVLKCQHSEEAKKILKTAYSSALESINTILGSECTVNDDASSNNATQNLPQNIILVQDPDRAKTKGRNARKKGHFETRDTASSFSEAVEFSSYAPNPKLF